MSWLRDDLVDRLIAKNAAKPRPGMDKPDPTMVVMSGRRPEKATGRKSSFDPATTTPAVQPPGTGTAPTS